MSTVYLIEIDTAIRVFDWINVGSGVFTRTLDAGMEVVTGVTEDGAALTLEDSYADCVANQTTYHFDQTTRKLTVHNSDNDTADDNAGHVVVVSILEAVATEGIIKQRGSNHVFWDGRVRVLPSYGQAILFDANVLASGSVATFGALVLENGDGRYDSLATQRVFAGQEVRIYKGTDTDPYADFELRARALMEQPVITPDALSVQLVSRARVLDRPILTSLFSTEDYAGMDANLQGVPIPKVWGAVVNAHAFRIASGTWKVCDHALTSITSCVDKDGAAVTVTAEDLPVGQFSVAADYDVDDRLYVTCTGYNVSLPGETMQHVLDVAGEPSANVDTGAFNKVDTDRAVNVGFQILSGTVRDVLNLVAQSTMVDWWVTRTGLFSAQARTRDAGNLVSNSGFETDTSGWTIGNNAALDRVTAVRFRGAACGEISKPAAQARAYAAAADLGAREGLALTATMMAAALTTTPSAWRVSLVDSVGTESLSAAQDLSTSEWTRVTVTFPPLADLVYCGDTDVYCGDTSYTCGTAGADLRIYPDYDGADNQTVYVDDVEVVETIALDDAKAGFEQASIVGPVVYRVRVGYAPDGRTNVSRFAEQLDTSVQKLYATAESREIPSVLEAGGDADTVAGVVMDYFGSGRVRAGLTLYDLSTSPSIGSIITLGTSRKPSLPGGGTLYRVVSVSDDHSQGNIPVVSLFADGVYDPIFKIEAVEIL